MDNINETEQGTQTEDMGRETDVQGAKTFTQEEVNNIIQSRLDKLKKQAASEQEEKYSKKAKELEARENKLLIREKLSERKMPAELAEVVTCTDEEDIEKKLDILQKLISEGQNNKVNRSYDAVYKPAGGSDVVHDSIRESMGL